MYSCAQPLFALYFMAYFLHTFHKQINWDCMYSTWSQTLIIILFRPMPHKLLKEQKVTYM